MSELEIHRLPEGSTLSPPPVVKQVEGKRKGLGARLVSKLTSLDGLYKIAKLVGSLVLTNSLIRGFGSSPLADNVGGFFKSFDKTVGSVQVINRTNVFVSGESKKAGWAKCVNVATLAIAKTFETIRFLADFSVINLAKASALVGCIPVVGSALNAFGLERAKNLFTIISCVAGVVVAGVALASLGRDHVKHGLTIANEVGKIGLVVLASCAQTLTLPFAFLANSVGLIAISRIVHNEMNAK